MPLSRINTGNYRSNKKSFNFKSPKLVVFALFASVLIIYPIAKSPVQKVEKPVEQKKEEEKSSVLANLAEQVKPKKKADPSKLIEDLNNTLSTTAGTYGVYIYELDTGDSFGINEEIVFPAASTVKVPLLMAVYKEIEKGTITREKVMTYIGSDYEEGTGSIQYTKIGGQWTIAELAKRMMKQSDNVAKNMFFRLLGHKNVQAYITGLGVKNVDMSMKNTNTPKDAGTLLKMLYNAETMNAELSNEIIELMVKTDFEKRLPRYIGKDVKVSHKIGTWAGAISDVGIVFLEDKPYVIAVYSKGIQNVETAESMIGDISKKVYEYERQRSK